MKEENECKFIDHGEFKCEDPTVLTPWLANYHNDYCGYHDKLECIKCRGKATHIGPPKPRTGIEALFLVNTIDGPYCEAH